MNILDQEIKIVKLQFNVGFDRSSIYIQVAFDTSNPDCFKINYE